MNAAACLRRSYGTGKTSGNLGRENSMKNRISMLMFLGVLLSGYSLAQVQTDCSTSGTSSGGQVNATTNCTSTDTGAATAERDRRNAEAGKDMGEALGTGLAGVILRHKEKKELKRQEEIREAKFEAYCDQHPGENWAWRTNGKVTSSGVCPGQMPFDLARRLYMRREQEAFAKAGVAGYAKFDGDVLTVHSERASLMRFHAHINDEKYLALLRTVNVKTYIYTNDADQTFKFDVANNREVTTDTTAVGGTPQPVAAPATTPAATVAPAAPPQ